MKDKEIGEKILAFIGANSMVSKLVSSQYKDEVATLGDIVNAEFGDEKRHVPMVHWNTVAFKFEEGLSASDFEMLYLEPAAIALAENLDRTILFEMALQAGKRVGTPGAGIRKSLPELQPGSRLIVGAAAEVELLKSVEFDPSNNQVWFNQNTPEVTTDLAFLGKEDDVSRVYDRRVLGDTNLLFTEESVVLCCRPLYGPTANDGRLSVRMTLEDVRTEDIIGHAPDVRKKAVIEFLCGVAVNPKETTVIFS